MIKSRKKSEYGLRRVVIYPPEIGPDHDLKSGPKLSRRRGMKKKRFILDRLSRSFGEKGDVHAERA
jgi:hypothetical protein